MDLNRAKEINKACLSFRLCEIDDTEPETEALKDVSLRDMVEARDMIAAKKSDDKSIPLYCGDRLIAAIYAITHFRACEPQAGIEPIVSLTKSCLVHVKWEKQDEDDEDE